VGYMADHPEDFDQLIQLAFSSNKPYCWRAAWLLWDCMEDNDSRIIPYTDRMVDALPDLKDGHFRELLKVLLKMDLGEEQEGLLYDVCVKYWESISKRPSVRYYAFLLMVRMAKKYPDLQHEIEVLTHSEYIDSLSPGVRKSVKKRLKEKPV